MLSQESNYKVIKIAFLCDWGMTSKDLFNLYITMTPFCSGRWENLICVDDVYMSDYIVVMENLPQNFKMEKLDFNKVIYIRREPTFIHKKNEIEKVAWISCDYDNLFHISDWKLNKDFDFLNSLLPANKKNKLVCIVSGKTFTSEHKKRLDFVKSFCQKYPEKIDLYGRQFLEQDITDFGYSYKGELNYDGDCKYLGLINYEYSLCIENNQEKNYFTEKINDSFLTWTMPIYYGCPNISDFFSKESYHEIDINKEEDIDCIVEIIEKSVTDNNLIAIDMSRKKILYEYSLWPMINKLLKSNKRIK